MSQEQLRALALQMAAHMGIERGKPQLRVVGTKQEPPRLGMCPITRTSHVRMVRHLAYMYKLHVLVDQATLGYTCVEDLPDEALVQLHNDIRTAIDNARMGIPLSETDLIKTDRMEAWG